MIQHRYPAWVAKKQKQPRTPKQERIANGRRQNCHSTPMKPEYQTIQLPTA